MPPPEFSPAMLRLFLRGRVNHAAFGLTGGARFDAIRDAKRDIRKRADVTNFVLDFAWMGRLNTATDRAKLWGALGIVPGDHGVRLTDDGGQAHAG